MSVIDLIRSAIETTPILCHEPAPPSVSAIQSVNIQCTPDPAWRTEIYNGELCTYIRNKPGATNEQICNACYPCCAINNTQTSMVVYKQGCVSQGDYGNRLIESITAKLATLPDDLKYQITSIMSQDIQSKLIDADRSIIMLQTIKITGVGVVQGIKQNIALNIVSQKILDIDRLKQLNDIINAYNGRTVNLLPLSSASQESSAPNISTPNISTVDNPPTSSVVIPDQPSTPPVKTSKPQTPANSPPIIIFYILFGIIILVIGVSIWLSYKARRGASSDVKTLMGIVSIY